MALLGLLVAVALGLSAAVQPEPSPEAGRTLFEQRCASCHTVGGGDLVGPDLQGVTERRTRDWLRRFIANPDEMRQTDKTAKQLAAEYAATMPNLGLSEAQVTDLIAYLRQQDQSSTDGQAPSTEPTQPQTPSQQESPSARQTASSQPPTPPQTAEPAAPTSEAQIGRALFTGTMRFDNGGPSCISCHNAGNVGALGGGALGPDLTNVVQRLGGPQAVAAWLSNPPTPTMRAVWSDRPLTDPEINQLIAFFQASGTTRSASAVWRLALLAFGGALIALLAMRLIWRRRLRAVREPLARHHY